MQRHHGDYFLPLGIKGEKYEINLICESRWGMTDWKLLKYSTPEEFEVN